MFFINFIMALIPVLGFNHDFAVNVDREEYCNERYGFCISYPDQFFDKTTYSDNGDGIALSGQNGRVKMDLVGSYNVMNWTIDDIMDSYFQTIKEKPMEVSLLELNTERTTGWAKMEYNYEIQWFKVNLFDDYYITTIITVPASTPELADQLSNFVTISIPNEELN